MLGLEGLVAWVLNNYLGKYVENLNTDQLSIALLQGEVELENLPLKKDALRQLGLPIQVRAGFVGKVKLQIPVRKIRSAPWVILIEQLYLVAGPVRLSEYDEEAEEQAAQEDKMARLDVLEARWRASQEAGSGAAAANMSGTSSYYSSSYMSWLSYGTSLMTNIIENLQLKIHDVHLRYEDEVTLSPGDPPFAVGVTVASLTAQSCDSDGNPHYTASWEASSGATFKLVELQALALYWDTHASLLGDLALGELAVAMHKVPTNEKAGESESRKPAGSPSSHDYVLSPVSGRALVRRDRSERPLRSRTQPRYVCDLQLGEVPLSLTDSQYGQMVSCLHGLQSIDKSRHYRKWRPLVGILDGGAREWWSYIARCHSQEARRRRGSCPNWPSLLGRAKDLVAYVDAYEAHLRSPSSLPLPAKLLRDRVEVELGLEELRVLREIAMSRMAQDMSSNVSTVDGSSQGSNDSPVPGAAQVKGKHQVHRGLLLHWMPLWWRWQNSDHQTLTSLTDEGGGQNDSEEMNSLEDEILDVLSDTIENDTLLRRDTVFGQLNFTLNQGTFKLFSKTKPISKKSSTTTFDRTLLMELEFASVKLGLEWRPRSSSHRFYIGLGAMYLRDAMTPDSAFSTLVSPHISSSLQSNAAPQFLSGTTRMQHLGRSFAERLGNLLGQTIAPSQTQAASRPVEDSLFQLVFEKKPFGSKADYRLHVQSQSLDVVYNASAFRCIIEFFTRPYEDEDLGSTLLEGKHFVGLN
ncbi:intermembrane lipid transfer protein VPS13D-like [Hetaerina americana]|uniref:intermembrane lipid transfer protein VPS13D-like n=1 Tax=Hetaerina americana TaxID=62018 RepID=UPI003A7F33E8